MADITYCAYAGCPIKSCERHVAKIPQAAITNNEYVSVCDFAPTCREYLSYVLEEVQNDGAQI